jgi:hypothetical protein
MKIVGLVALSLFIMGAGCRQKTVKIRMLPALAESDSAVVMYYHTPGDPRFFNMIKVKGKNPIPVAAADANGPVITAKDSCVTQGKIYFYGKNDAVETLYFSRNNDCMTLSFIQTGEKYFTGMSEATKALLDSLEKNMTVLPGRSE